MYHRDDDDNIVITLIILLKRDTAVQWRRKKKQERKKCVILIIQKYASGRQVGTLTTLSLAWISRSLRRAKTCMCELTCFRVRVLPVRSFMYLAISSLRPETRGTRLVSRLVGRAHRRVTSTIKAMSYANGITSYKNTWADRTVVDGLGRRQTRKSWDYSIQPEGRGQDRATLSLL